MHITMKLAEKKTELCHVAWIVLGLRTQTVLGRSFDLFYTAVSSFVKWGGRIWSWSKSSFLTLNLRSLERWESSKFFNTNPWGERRPSKKIRHGNFHAWFSYWIERYDNGSPNARKKKLFKNKGINYFPMNFLSTSSI